MPPETPPAPGRAQSPAGGPSPASADPEGLALDGPGPPTGRPVLGGPVLSSRRGAAASAASGAGPCSPGLGPCSRRTRLMGRLAREDICGPIHQTDSLRPCRAAALVLARGGTTAMTVTARLKRDGRAGSLAQGGAATAVTAGCGRCARTHISGRWMSCCVADQ